MAERSSGFDFGTLGSRIAQRAAAALARGALRPIETRQEFIQQGAVRFLVRVLSSLAHKREAQRNRPVGANPFAPYEAELFVAELSATHVALLNKYPIIDHHLLIATRRFEDQETLLTAADFAAFHTCLRELEGLGFYNGGAIAGASERHKHLQIVPLPLAPRGPTVPIAPLLEAVSATDRGVCVPGLDFRHAFLRLDPALLASVDAGGELEMRYAALLEHAGVGFVERDGARWHSAPYNLLLTREWMLLVPRLHECFESISINALGFAGALLVRTEQELKHVRQVGPLAVLQQVAVSTVRTRAT